MIVDVLWFGIWAIVLFGAAISTDGPACWYYLICAAFSYYGFRDAVRASK